MAQPAGTATDDVLAAVAGRSGWIISDGKAGNDVQSRGVFDVMQLDYLTKHVEPTGIWKLLAPWGPVNPAERLGAPGSAFQPPWPEFAIAIGRLTIPYLRRLRQLAGRSTYTVILLDPRVGSEAG